MPRPPRLEPPGVPLHVLQRGNNRAACFFGDIDRRFYLKCLAESAARHACVIHAYVLMSNHVHLLVTPSKSGAIAATMQDIGRKYVRVINALHGRTGTLWEGRFKSSVIDSERYVLACHRYIELNPVRAGMVARPGDFLWSSHNHYCGIRDNALIADHDWFRALGLTLGERRSAFQDLFSEDLDEATLARIRGAINAGCPISQEPPVRGRPRGRKEGNAPDSSGDAPEAGAVSRNLF